MSNGTFSAKAETSARRTTAQEKSVPRPETAVQGSSPPPQARQRSRGYHWKRWQAAQRGMASCSRAAASQKPRVPSHAVSGQREVGRLHARLSTSVLARWPV